MNGGLFQKKVCSKIIIMYSIKYSGNKQDIYKIPSDLAFINEMPTTYFFFTFLTFWLPWPQYFDTGLKNVVFTALNTEF